MPTPRSSSSKAAEPSPAAPKPAAVPWQQPRPANEPSSVIGTGIPADVSDFAVVYKGASVQAPAHGYGIDRIAGMLAHGSLAGLDKSVKAGSIILLHPNYPTTAAALPRIIASIRAKGLQPVTLHALLGV